MENILHAKHLDATSHTIITPVGDAEIADWDRNTDESVPLVGGDGKPRRRCSRWWWVAGIAGVCVIAAGGTVLALYLTNKL